MTQMTKVINHILVVAVMFSAAGAGLWADEVRPTGDERRTLPVAIEGKKTSPGYFNRKLFIGVYGGSGVNYFTGSISGTGSQDTREGEALVFGLWLGYRVLDWGLITFGIEKIDKAGVVSRTQTGVPLVSRYSFSFIDATLGFRGVLRVFYGDAGFYWGRRIGTWREEATLGTNPEVTNTIPEGDRNDELGMYCGVGIMGRVHETVSIESGIRVMNSFLAAYENDYGDSIKTTAVLFTLGVAYRI